MVSSLALGLIWAGASIAQAQQSSAPAPGQSQKSGDPLALYGMDTGEQAPGVSYDREEDQRLREFERRRSGMLRGFANGTIGSSSTGSSMPSEQEVRSGLVYTEEENARLDAAGTRQTDLQQAVVESQSGATGGVTSSATDTAIDRNLSKVDETAIQQADAFNQTVEDFQNDLGLLGGDENAECVMGSALSGCPMNQDAIEASFQQGVSTDIMDPNATGQPGGAGAVTPISTTSSDFQEDISSLPPELQDDFNQDALSPTYVPGEGTYGPDGEPINLDDLSWSTVASTEEQRTLDWDGYYEYKYWGFDMDGFEWLGSNRFLMPRNFFLKEEMELGPRQEMVSQDQQIAMGDRLITFHQYHDLINDRYNMSGVRYFGDDLGIQLMSYNYWTCDRRLLSNDDDYRYREPWYCDEEAYELPKDFFERQDRNPGWQARLNYRGYNDNDR